MKKVMRIMGLACMAGLLAFTSCKKNQDTSAVNVIMPPMTGVSIDDERAYIDDEMHFMWHQEDYIYVYNLSDVYTESVVNVFENTSGQGPTATFHGSEMGAPKTYEYRYFYPINMVSGDPEELAVENRQTFTVDPIQQFEAYEAPDHPISAVDPDQMPMTINTDDLSAYAQLKHIFGMARICLKGKSGKEVRVQSITINDNYFDLWGTASLKLHEVNMATLTSLINKYKANDMEGFEADYASYVIGTLGWLPNDDGDQSITLDCTVGDPAGVVLPNQNALQYQYFFFMLRPLALSHGFTFDIEYTVDGEPKTKHVTNWENHTSQLQFCMEPGIYKSWTLRTALQ
jgi:hypothetical protein